MLREFIVNAQKYRVQTNMEKAGADEAKIKFENRRQIHAFLGNAMRYGNNSTSIQRIAKDVATSYCPTKNAPKRSDQDFFQEMGGGPQNLDNMLSSKSA